MNASNDLAAGFLELISTPDRPGLGPNVRSTVEKPSELNAKVRSWANAQQLDAEHIDLLRSAALLWHDHLEASHSISQSIHSSTGSFLHGIMHRREPDYGNAKYWFHRVGSHGAYSAITTEVKEQLLKGGLSSSLSDVVESGDWDPFGFVDLVSRELGNTENQDLINELQCLQEIEFQCLVRNFFED